MSSLAKKITIKLVKKLLWKMRTLYKSKYKKDLSIILVAGTVGKTSQTLILNQFFEKNGWKVLTGTTQTKNLNTITGLAMALGSFFVDVQKNIFSKLYFIGKLFILANLKRQDISEKTILIFEVGFDYQGESQDYLDIFNSGVECVIITALTHEHAQNFNLETLNEKMLTEMENIVPELLLTKIKNSDSEIVIKNIALEQLNLLKLTKKYIIPSQIEYISNQIISNINENNRAELSLVNISRGKDYSLVIDSTYSFNKHYLLPDSFAKFGQSVFLVSQLYKIDTSSYKDFLKSVRLANSRFGYLKGVNNSTIIDSTYNCDPASLFGFLTDFKTVSEKLDREVAQAKEKELDSESSKIVEIPLESKHYLILGEMRELGKVAKREHQIILDYLIELEKANPERLEEIVLVGDSWLECDENKIPKMDGVVSYLYYKGKIFKVYKKVKDLKTYINKESLRFNSWVWLKGSQNTIFLEEMVKSLLLDQFDSKYLCRQSQSWIDKKSFWV